MRHTDYSFHLTTISYMALVIACIIAAARYCEAVNFLSAAGWTTAASVFGSDTTPPVLLGAIIIFVVGKGCCEYLSHHKSISEAQHAQKPSQNHQYKFRPRTEEIPKQQLLQTPKNVPYVPSLTGSSLTLRPQMTIHPGQRKTWEIRAMGEEHKDSVTETETEVLPGMMPLLAKRPQPTTVMHPEPQTMGAEKYTAYMTETETEVLPVMMPLLAKRQAFQSKKSIEPKERYWYSMEQGYRNNLMRQSDSSRHEAMDTPEMGGCQSNRQHIHPLALHSSDLKPGGDNCKPPLLHKQGDDAMIRAEAKKRNHQDLSKTHNTLQKPSPFRQEKKGRT
jgi:hypothetical protein